MANLKFKVEALRTLTSPYRKGDKDESTFETIYYLLVDMKELPSSIPMDVNPREPKMTTNVARLPPLLSLKLTSTSITAVL